MADLLIRLMALAAEDDDVARFGMVHGPFDGLWPVFDDGGRRLRAVHARHDLADDLVGIFGAGIIRGDDGHIGESGGNTAHDGALEGVAVAAAAKDGDDVPAAEAAHGLQNVLEAVRRV